MLEQAIKIVRERGEESVNVTRLGDLIGYIIANCPKSWLKDDDKIVRCGIAMYFKDDLSEFRS